MLGHPIDPVKSNAAAYLQHLCYESDKVKREVRRLKGVPALVCLLDHPKAEVHRKACGALRNISYGRDNDNKVAIKNCDGIPALVRLLRKTSDMEVRELVTGAPPPAPQLIHLGDLVLCSAWFLVSQPALCPTDLSASRYIVAPRRNLEGEMVPQIPGRRTEPASVKRSGLPRPFRVCPGKKKQNRSSLSAINASLLIHTPERRSVFCERTICAGQPAQGRDPAAVRFRLNPSERGAAKELGTAYRGTLWNLSSYEPLKMVVINHGLQTMTNEVIIPHSGWDPEPDEDSKPRDAEWTTVFKNTSGCLRNVSSDGAEARRRLRECDGLVDALLHALQSAVGKKDMDNKSVENCVCIMRNLSYHVHKEVPGAEKYQDASELTVPGSAGPQRKKKDDAGCFGGKKAKGRRNGENDKSYDTLDLPKRTEPTKGKCVLHAGVASTTCHAHALFKHTGQSERGFKKTNEQARSPNGSEVLRELEQSGRTNTAVAPSVHNAYTHALGPLVCSGFELLYQPEVVRLYLSLLTESQNYNTLEAAAGALQNLSAGQWTWSNYIRATVRKEKGLPILVELLRSDSDKVVRAVAIALRNLSIDRRNKDLIGNYAMRDLVSNLPSGQQRPAKNLEEDTVVAILNTIHEIVTDSSENARSLVSAQAIDKLVAINRTSQASRETKAASHILQTVWSYKELRNALIKDGWNKTHFQPPLSSAPKGSKSSKPGYDDTTLPLMEKNQGQCQRSPSGACHFRLTPACGNEMRETDVGCFAGDRGCGTMIPMDDLGPDGYSTIDQRDKDGPYRAGHVSSDLMEREPLKVRPTLHSKNQSFSQTPASGNPGRRQAAAPDRVSDRETGFPWRLDGRCTTSRPDMDLITTAILSRTRPATRNHQQIFLRERVSERENTPYFQRAAIKLRFSRQDESSAATLW
ncbi:hypothetical protein P4O66_005350 [Electrophorus voltai]|uniref:ARVCF delta catenin family member b n=1 Tax=Electrophorus voltai TaxID=2609070 RepID=A0AAD8ZX26_9TELE|nr:hypothetical protein P4O66_005350 [Electrophorus voltai]